MGNAVNDVIRQATGRRPVENIDMDYVTVAQNTVVGELEFTGDVVQFNTGSSVPIRKLEVSMEPVQSGSGDPSPENVRPISGWTGCNVTRTGKNLFNPSAVEDGTFDQTTGEKIPGTQSQQRSTYFVKCNPGDEIIQKNNASLSMRLFYFNGTSYVSSVAIANNTVKTVPANVDRFYFSSGTSAFSAYTNLQIEFGSAADAYEPYTGETITTEFPTPPGTVYGGTLDLITGVLTVTWAKSTKDLQTIAYSTASSGAKRYFTFAEDVDGTEYTNAICNVFKSTEITSSTTDVGIGTILSGGTNPRIAIRPPDVENISTVNEFKTYLATLGTIDIIFKMNTPQTYQLTPQEVNTLVGDNTVYSDAGTVDVMYWFIRSCF